MKANLTEERKSEPAKADGVEERKPEPGSDAGPKPARAESVTDAVYVLAGFSPYARIDQLPRSEALRLCEIDRAERERKADRHHKAGLGCKLAAATFARTRQACRSFYRHCMTQPLARPQSEDLCKKLNPAACSITVVEFAACREAEQRMIHELLQKLDCDYEGPRLTAPLPLPECDTPKQRCPAFFDHPTRPPPRSRRRGKSP
jgi:hypothetical protein